MASAAGVSLGLLGHLFLRNPAVFLRVFSLLSFGAPFLLAIGTVLWVGLRRKSTGFMPVCGQCKNDLPSIHVDRVKDCLHCGAELAGPKGVLFVREPGRRWGLVAWGGVLLVMPIVGIGVLSVAQQFVGPSPGNLRLQSTQQLIQQQLPNQINQPWVWQELEYRLKKRSLSQQEVDDAIKALTSHMTTTRPQGWDQPLSWQQGFLKAAMQAGKISEPELLALCDAFYGPKAALGPLPRLRESDSGFPVAIEYGSPWSGQSGLGLDLLWQVDRVLLDNKPFNVRETSKTGRDWSGFHEGAVAVGDHQLTVEVDCAYVDQNKLVGLNAGDLPKSRWPEARKRWRQSVSAPLKVYPKDKPLVSLATDVERDPGPTGGVTIDRLVVQTGRDRGKMIILKAEISQGMPVSLSYDVAVHAGGRLIKLGHLWMAQYKDGRTQGGQHLEATVDTLDSAITAADVVLTPNPRHIESCPDVSEIWGKKITLPDIPLERLDLETEQGAKGP